MLKITRVRRWVQNRPGVLYLDAVIRYTRGESLQTGRARVDAAIDRGDIERRPCPDRPDWTRLYPTKASSGDKPVYLHYELKKEDR